jgi:ubiquinone/menaquinone biosynthesis C-methylase UbiE
MTARQAIYTHGQHEAVLRSHRWRTARNSAAYLIDHLRPGMTLLDIGCGAGTITADLAALVAPGRVTAADASPEALTQARETIRGRGLTNVVVAAADLHALPYPDASFDVVHAHQVLQHVADPVRALREMRRVCRPSGLVAARDSDYQAMTWYPEVAALDEWLTLYRTVARHNGGEPDAGRQLRAWARRAGCTDVVSTASAWCYSTADERAWWSALWADRMLTSAVGGQAMEYGYASRADLERIADGWRTWGAADEGWFAVLHGEVLIRVPS